VITRRGFFGAVAALVASRVAPVPVAAAPAVEWTGRLYTVPAPDGGFYYFTQNATYHAWPRRDDGDTILELR
jgi:hypothetical protein